MNKEQSLDILNITYLRIMQLYFGWQFISTMVLNNNIQNHYPNLCYSLVSSFATDAYTTVSGLLSTGNYSLGRLGQEDSDIKAKIQNAENKLGKTVDNFREVRNKMFCHAVNKKSSDAIYKIYNNFELVFQILTELHSYCCQKLNMPENELRGYDNKTFKLLQEEITDFQDLLMYGNLEKITRDFFKNKQKGNN